MSTGTNSDNLPIVSKGSECIGSVHKAFSLLAQKPCFCFEVDTVVLYPNIYPGPHAALSSHSKFFQMCF